MEKVQENLKEVAEVTKEFYRALQAICKGDTAPMERVWSHADDVTYLGPQGDILVGWSQVFRSWKEQAEMNLKGSVEPKGMQIRSNSNIAIVQNFEVGTINVQGHEETLHIRATNIFQKENGDWKMISHQTDLIPSIAK